LRYKKSKGANRGSDPNYLANPSDRLRHVADGPLTGRGANRHYKSAQGLVGYHAVRGHSLKLPHNGVTPSYLVFALWENL